MRDPAPALIDAAELARRLSVSRASIWRWIADSRLPEPIRLTSQCLRWRADAITEWIERGCPPCDQNNDGPDRATDPGRNNGHPAKQLEVAR